MHYRDAGVDLDRADRLVAWLKQRLPRSPIGAFGSAFPLAHLSSYQDPVLVATTDGVGTKILLLAQYERWTTVGNDVVAMCINDLLAQGAHPLFFLDYYATVQLDEKIFRNVVDGIVQALEPGNVPLIGGETAELPGFFREGVPLDVAGFAVGIVERERLASPQRLHEGDRLLGLPSSGPHSNGYSLIRAILEEASPPESVLEFLLSPTVIYWDVDRAFQEGWVTAAVHVTGGGIPGNLSRILPEHLDAHVQFTWEIPEGFRWLMARGEVPMEEAMRVWNLGIGMILVVPSSQFETAQKHFPNGVWMGELVRGSGQVRLS